MERIIIDTDPGVDDAMAILMALKVPNQLKVEALTTVDGNVGLEKVTRNALAILELAEREDIPVYKGAAHPLGRGQEYCDDFHGDNGMGNVELPEPQKTVEAENAVDFMISMVNDNPGEIVLVPIGPLTNIALAVQKDPDFAKKVKRVVIMGGAEHGGNMSPVAEFNFYHDPIAAKIVFEAGFQEIIMVGLDATGKVYMNPAMRELCHLIGTPISKFEYDITRVYTDGRWQLNRVMGCQMCDPLVIGYLIDENILELKESHVEIETSGRCEGMSVVYRKERYPEMPTNCKVAVNADPKRFFEIFYGIQFPEYEEYAKKMLEHEYRS